MTQGRAPSTQLGPPQRRRAGTPGSLSRRQLQVLELLANGIPAREIAVRLDLAEATVRNHIRILFRRLGCHAQIEAVAVGYRLGLLEHSRLGSSAAPQPAGDIVAEP